jgi:hypothetical protein
MRCFLSRLTYTVVKVLRPTTDVVNPAETQPPLAGGVSPAFNCPIGGPDHACIQHGLAHHWHLKAGVLFSSSPYPS